MIKLPDVLPGHWETDEGSGMAKHYLADHPTRVTLFGGKHSDFAVAFQIAMVGLNDLDHEAKLLMAKDRIRWLSVHLAVAQADRASLLHAAKVTNAAVGERRIEGMDQNPKGWRDILFSAITQAERKP